jgi:hypothetical protein
MLGINPGANHADTDKSQAAENVTKRGKNFLQGLKPAESTQFTSVLKHRPPEEKDFFHSLKSVCATSGKAPGCHRRDM